MKKSQLKTILLLTSSMVFMADVMLSPALPDINRFFKDQPNVLVKLILTIPSLMIALLAAPIGMLSDRFGRKKLLMLSLAIFGAMGSLGFFIKNLYMLLFTRALLGIGVAGVISLSTTLISDYFSGEERKKFTGWQAAIISIGGIIFLYIGGLLAGTGWKNIFLLYPLLFLLIPLVSLYLVEPQKETPSQNSNRNNSQTLKLIIFICIISFLSKIFFYMFPVQVPFLLKSEVETNETLTGLAIACSSLTAALASLAYSYLQKKYHFKTLYIISFIIMAAGYTSIGFFKNYAGILTGLAFGGAAIGIILPNSTYWLMEISSVANRGKMIGWLAAAMFFGQFISPLCLEPLIKQVGLNNTFYLVAAAMGVIAIVIFLFPATAKKQMA